MSTDESGPGFNKLHRLRPPRGGGHWKLGSGRTIIRRQNRLTRQGGGARKAPKQNALKVYRRKSVVKIAYNGQKGKPWRERAAYLGREHAQIVGERGLGFDADHDRVDVADMMATADGWQKAGDTILWRFIVSPDDAKQIDLKEHAREIIAAMERDLGTKLEWIGIDHHPADEDDHIHMLLRGRRDDGKELRMDRDYITAGIREISQSLIEKQLGPRNEHDMLVARERGIQGQHWTEIDRTLEHRMDGDRIVAYQGTPWTQEGKDRMRQEVERLVFLEKLGLAKALGESTWQLAPDHHEKLREMQQNRDIIKRMERERQQGLERDIG